MEIIWPCCYSKHEKVDGPKYSFLIRAFLLGRSMGRFFTVGKTNALVVILKWKN